jgi:hypothetical protein
MKECPCFFPPQKAYPDFSYHTNLNSDTGIMPPSKGSKSSFVTRICPIPIMEIQSRHEKIKIAFVVAIQFM